ncbi:hypothetical protein Efla_006168 [Eimeria flavescens]
MRLHVQSCAGLLLLLLLLPLRCLPATVSPRASRLLLHHQAEARSWIDPTFRAPWARACWASLAAGELLRSSRSSSSSRSCSSSSRCYWMRLTAAVSSALLPKSRSSRSSLFAEAFPAALTTTRTAAAAAISAAEGAAAAAVAASPAATAASALCWSRCSFLKPFSLCSLQRAQAIPVSAATAAAAPAGSSAPGAARAAIAAAAAKGTAAAAAAGALGDYGVQVMAPPSRAAGPAGQEKREELRGPSAAALAAAAARAPAAVAAGVSLKLTPGEEHLFSQLNQCVRDRKLNVELRAAGGWVRDRLLGLPSKDVDIAIDSMTGAAFADTLRGWLAERGCSPLAYGVISKCAEQSKHLETATLRLFSFDVDLVNLRSEAYSDSSRIPSLTLLGTPLEDAARRDFCCNALFFNLNSRLVEDWLGKGLSDLERGLVRAAHPCPYTTLIDDPLRLLRGVRFAVALGFKLHAPLAAAAAADDIHDALRKKIARERIGIELKKIFSVSRKKQTEADSDADTGAATPARAAADAGAAPEAAAEAASTAAESPAVYTPGGSLEKELLEGPLHAALRAVLLLQQLRVWDTLVSLAEGHELFRQPDEGAALDVEKGEGGASAAGRKRLGPNAFAKLLRGTQRPLTLGEGAPQGGPLGASCLLALRHVLARGPLLQRLAQSGSEAAAAAAAAAETDTGSLCEGLTRGLELQVGSDLLRQLLFAAALLPLRGLLAVSNAAPKVRPAAGSVVSRSWVLPSADATAVESLVDQAAELRAAAEEEVALQQQQQQQQQREHLQQEERVRLGLLIRRVGPQWRAALTLAAAEALGRLIHEDTGAAVAAASAALKGPSRSPSPAAAAAAEAAEEQPSSEKRRSCEKEGLPDPKKLCSAEAPPAVTPGPLASQDGGVAPQPAAAATAEAGVEDDEANAVAAEVCLGALDCLLLQREGAARETLEGLVRLRDRIDALGLHDAWTLQPLLNGKQIASLLPRASGPRIGEVMEVQRSWQLANPGKPAEECMQHLRAVFKDLTEGAPNEKAALSNHQAAAES